jgi:dipeptidyl aminopeptidase/acylaminoacyl peptidase
VSDPLDRAPRAAPADWAAGRSRSAASLADALRSAPLPGADAARTRAWAVLSDAHASRMPVARGRRRGRVVALAFAVALAGAAVAVAADSPRWVRDVLGAARSAPPARVSLGALPAGRVLVSSSQGTWIVRGDGTRVRLGPWTGATWSPRGLYVAAWRGRELSAVAPDGRVAWTVAAPAAVRDARWSPDGYRIAYRRAGGLAVVAGDGTGARVLASAVRAVAPAWRPGERHTLAWVGARGRVEVRDVDTGRVAWRSGVSVGAVRELLWSSDGRRLLARGQRRLMVFDVGAGRVRRVGLPRGARVTAAAWAPRGRRLAVALRTGTSSRIVVTASIDLSARPTFAAPGTLSSLAWSPDASRLLVRWRESDQWLLLPTSGHGRATAIADVSHRFGPSPAVQGWCCA